MKKLILIFLLFSYGAVAFVYYYWQQVTQLPEWYKTQSPLTQQKLDWNNSEELMAAQARLQEKVKASIAKSQAIAAENTLDIRSQSNTKSKTFKEFSSDCSEQESSTNKSVEIELNNQEVNTLFMTTLAQDSKLSSLLTNTAGINTTIKDGILEIGTVINLGNLSKNQLNKRELAAFEKARKTLPFLENKKLYVAISGQPKIKNGKIKLDEDTKIKLGNLGLSIPELAQHMGIPQDKIKQKMQLPLLIEDLKIEDLKITNNKALLKGLVD